MSTLAQTGVLSELTLSELINTIKTECHPNLVKLLYLIDSPQNEQLLVNLGKPVNPHSVLGKLYLNKAFFQCLYTALRKKISENQSIHAAFLAVLEKEQLLLRLQTKEQMHQSTVRIRNRRQQEEQAASVTEPTKDQQAACRAQLTYALIAWKLYERALEHITAPETAQQLLGFTLTTEGQLAFTNTVATLLEDYQEHIVTKEQRKKTTQRVTSGTTTFSNSHFEDLDRTNLYIRLHPTLKDFLLQKNVAAQAAPIKTSPAQVNRILEAIVAQLQTLDFEQQCENALNTLKPFHQYPLRRLDGTMELLDLSEFVKIHCPRPTNMRLVPGSVLAAKVEDEERTRVQQTRRLHFQGS